MLIQHGNRWKKALSLPLPQWRGELIDCRVSIYILKSSCSVITDFKATVNIPDFSQWGEYNMKIEQTGGHPVSCHRDGWCKTNYWGLRLFKITGFQFMIAFFHNATTPHCLCLSNKAMVKSQFGSIHLHSAACHSKMFVSIDPQRTMTCDTAVHGVLANTTDRSNLDIGCRSKWQKWKYVS